MGGEVPLHLGHGRDAGARRAEGGEEAVSCRVHLPPIVGGEALPDDPVVVAKDRLVGLAEARELLGRALDVGEEEGDQGLRSNSLETRTVQPGGRL